MSMNSCRIILADGTEFSGTSFGASGTNIGEFVFHTGLTGYQEILTDPSYCGQIVTMTYPEIGNTGINPEDMESNRAWLGGFIARSVSPVVSNWRASQSLDAFLAEQGVVGCCGIDTRSLTLRLREYGAMMGIVSNELTTEEMKNQLDGTERIEEQDLVSQVSTRQRYLWDEGSWSMGREFKKITDPEFTIVALDFGIKKNILRRLADQSCHIHVCPADTSLEDLLRIDADGYFLSNGPGDPRTRRDLSEKVSHLIGRKPIFGICFGFQILGMALGASIAKLEFGHHGANHPVKCVDSNNVWITSQNHNYVVEADTLPKGCVASDINLNDQTLEGFRDDERGVLAIQYHPEASPGPHDALQLFNTFSEMMRTWKS